MKTRIYIIALLSMLMVSCNADEIKTYDIKDSAVVFKTKSVQFSMKGVTDEYVSRTISLDLIGPLADYDRKIDIRVVDDAENTAVENVDFMIGEAVMREGKYIADVEFTIHQLPEGVEKQMVTLEIVPNEHFRKGYPATSKIVVSWSNEYVRPSVQVVWREWYFFFCKGYSKNYHKLLVEIFGTGIETYTRSSAEVKNDPTLELKQNDWWYGANNKLIDYVKKYDAAHPGAPLMHSEDYEAYSDVSLPVGSGIKPERIPTIYETLNQI